jgi:hypothetical protein
MNIDHELVLVSARKSRGSNHWGNDAYDVRRVDTRGPVVGLIFRSTVAPKPRWLHWRQRSLQRNKACGVVWCRLVAANSQFRERRPLSGGLVLLVSHAASAVFTSARHFPSVSICPCRQGTNHAYSNLNSPKSFAATQCGKRQCC